MNSIFRPYLHCFVIVFFDDILIYSILEGHLSHLATVFQVLVEGQFILKRAKCSFKQTQVEYLGHVVLVMGVVPVSLKVQAIQDWPVPQSIRAIRNFLGLAGFYRRFARGYASIVAPLIKATTMDSFKWTTNT